MSWPDVAIVLIQCVFIGFIIRLFFRSTDGKG